VVNYFDKKERLLTLLLKHSGLRRRGLERTFDTRGVKSPLEWNQVPETYGQKKKKQGEKIMGQIPSSEKAGGRRSQKRGGGLCVPFCKGEVGCLHGVWERA